MKSKLCSVLVVLSIAVLSATAVHADEPGAVGVEETVSETGEPAPAGSDSLPANKAARKAKRDRRVGTALMIAAFVAQGISVGITSPTVVYGDIIYNIWPVQVGTIPFAPMGVHGFALRFGGSDKLERLRWTGIGLLQAAAYSGVMAALSFASTFSATLEEPGILSDGTVHLWEFRRGFRPLNIATTISYSTASIAFVIAGASSIKAAKRAKHRQVQSQSRRSPAKSTHRGFVMPTIAPRSGGVSLGLTGVF